MYHTCTHSYDITTVTMISQFSLFFTTFQPWHVARRNFLDGDSKRLHLFEKFSAVTQHRRNDFFAEQSGSRLPGCNGHCNTVFGFGYGQQRWRTHWNWYCCRVLNGKGSSMTMAGVPTFGVRYFHNSLTRTMEFEITANQNHPLKSPPTEIPPLCFACMSHVRVSCWSHTCILMYKHVLTGYVNVSLVPHIECTENSCCMYWMQTTCDRYNPHVLSMHVFIHGYSWNAPTSKTKGYATVILDVSLSNGTKNSWNSTKTFLCCFLFLGVCFPLLCCLVLFAIALVVLCVGLTRCCSGKGGGFRVLTFRVYTLCHFYFYCFVCHSLFFLLLFFLFLFLRLVVQGWGWLVFSVTAVVFVGGRVVAGFLLLQLVLLP